MPKLVCSLIAVASLLLTSTLDAQPPGGRGGPPGFGQAKRPLLDQFDANDDGWLNQEERAEARKFLAENPPENRRGRRGGQGRAGGARRGFDPERAFEREDDNSDGRLTPKEVEGSPLARDFGRVDSNGDGAITLEEFRAGMENRMRRGGGRRGRGGNRPPATPGEKIAVSEVEPVGAPLYDPSVLRTIFIDFENEEWEAELDAFHNTDVEVPAKLTVDGKEYPLCGMRFRGASSYMMVPAGHKRSFNVSLDLVDDDQRLYGSKTLNLLNCNGDPSFMSTVLYSQLANEHLPAPKANLVRVVVNGENWGVYTNAQQFNREFLREHYSSAKGTRWKVDGSPRGGGGLDYRGLDPEAYGHPYVMKDGDEKAMAQFIELCRVLDEVPAGDLKAALADKVDIDELLWFLAYDNALCNSDGYWVRASDYSIYLDAKGKFHFFPHDMNESFREVGGRRRGGRGGRGGEAPASRGLDPLIGMDDDQKPLRSKILAVPEFRDQYLANMRVIADQLDWKNLGPKVAGLRSLIRKEVERDTRKLSSFEDFVSVTSEELPEASESGGGRGGASARHLRKWAESRRAFLLDYLKDRAKPDAWLTR